MCYTWALLTTAPMSELHSNTTFGRTSRTIISGLGHFSNIFADTMRLRTNRHWTISNKIPLLKLMGPTFVLACLRY